MNRVRRSILLAAIALIALLAACTPGSTPGAGGSAAPGSGAPASPGASAKGNY